MKRKLIIALILTSSLMFQSGCLVWDSLKEIALEADRLFRQAKWEKYLDKLEELLEEKKDLKLAFEVNKAPMKPGVRKLFKDNVILAELAENTQTRDPEKKDPWWDVWNGDKTIYEKVPDFKQNYSELKNTEIYRKDELMKKYIDEMIKIEKENRKDFEGLIRFVVDSQKLENGEQIEKGTNVYEGGGIDRLKNFQDQLLKFSKYGQEGKMKALLSFIENEILKTEMIIETTKRAVTEYMLKLEVREVILAEKYSEIFKGASK